METKSSFLRLLGVFATGMILAACGGSGGGDDGGGGTGVAAPLAIDAGNAESVAGAVVEITSDMADVGGLTGDLGTLSVNTTTTPAGLVDRHLRDWLAAGRGGGVSALAVSTFTEDCDPPPGGGTPGTVTFTENDADDSGTPSAGDSLTVAFSNCFEAFDGLTFNGSLQITITALSGDDIEGGTDLTATVTASFNDLSLTDDGVTESVDGTISLTLDIDGATGTESLELVISELTATSGGTEDVVADANISVSVDATGAVTVTVAATFSFAGLGGSVTVETVVAFQSVDDQANPSAGEVLVTGAGGSSVRLTAEPDGVNVVLDVDADGVGGAETQINTTWAALDPDTVG